MSKYIAELFALTIVSASFMRDTILSLAIALTPFSMIIPTLATLIIACIFVITLSVYFKFNILPIWLYICSFYILQFLCIANNPTYLPLPVKILAFCVCLIVSWQVIAGCFEHRKTLYVYQFEIIDKLKIRILNVVILNIIHIWGTMLSGDYLNLLFILPYFLLLYYYFKMQKYSFGSKFTIILILLATLFACYFIGNNMNEYYYQAFNLSILLIFFVIRDNLEKKQMSLLLTVVLIICEFSIYSSLLKVFPKAFDNTLNIIGIIINISMFIIAIVNIKKIKIQNFNKLLSNLFGEYDESEIVLQISEEYNLAQKEVISGEGFVPASLSRAIEYSKIMGVATIDERIISAVSDLEKDEIPEVEKELHISGNENKFIRIFKLYWRIGVTIIVLLTWLSLFVAPFNTTLIKWLESKGNIGICLNTIQYSKIYSNSVVYYLNDENTRFNLLFPEYVAKEFSNKAIVYGVNGNLQMQKKALSASLLFNKDYNVLYSRYLLNDQLKNFHEALEDIDELLSMEKCTEVDSYNLRFNRSSFCVNCGNFDKAFEEAEFCFSYENSIENEAWLYACNIGIGKSQEAYHSLNDLLCENTNLPSWVYRMRGLALLTLIEKGDSQSIDIMKDDIIYAYDSEKTLNNILAYARLLLFENKYQEAFEAIQNAVDENPNDGRVYFWLSKYYELTSDLLNQQKMLEKARTLHYEGNGEY